MLEQKVSICLLLSRSNINIFTIKRRLSGELRLRTYNPTKNSRHMSICKLKDWHLQKLSLIGQLKRGKKYCYLISQLCNSLHLASMLSEDLLVPSIKIVTSFNNETPHKYPGFGYNVCKSTDGLYFLQPGTKMNCAKHLNLFT